MIFVLNLRLHNSSRQRASVSS